MATGSKEVGVVGLGLMGAQIARHLVDAGWAVRGHDLRPEAGAALEAAGGVFCPDVAGAFVSGGITLLSLPSSSALRTVLDTLLANAAHPRCVVDTSTLSVADKEWARDRLGELSVEFIDCPLSGTAAQMTHKDVVAFASGCEVAVADVTPLLEAFCRVVYFVGPCGAGTKLKLVANLLVAVHNVAAAEAINLARRAGLDADLVVRAIGEGAGGSRMLQVRGPMMAERRYRPATMKIDVFRKDLDLIGAFAADCGAATPLLAAAAELYRAASAEGLDGEDTAAVCSVLENMALSAKEN
ncbi:MAG: NAD(P)-dependent oxidoreductase [Reyranella sp.]|jgi:3-hydroxyisobutyrate dehydrogenase-like beta-hydroxyacid dehydrogenase|nr:NAD(P)-dependent oxidoreductase [Reyranella sp.]